MPAYPTRASAFVAATLFACLVVPAGCTGTGEGSGCISSRDCSSAGLVCHPDLLECVQCVSIVDCFGADEICRANRCEAVMLCSSSRQCPGQVCNTVLGFCVDCVSNADCDVGEECTPDGLCEEPPPPCMSDRQCSGLGLVCDLAAEICVECVRDADCGGGRCSGNRCVASTCSPGENECVGSDGFRSCDTSGNWGGTLACSAGQTCGGGICSDGTCSPSCAPGEGCSGGTCRCGTAAACTGSQSCIGGICIDPSCSPGCGTNETCAAGICFCGSSPACTGGDICNGTTCVTATCSPACGGGESCVGGTCQCGAGPACPSGQDCISGFCIPSTCSPLCDPGETCNVTTCMCGTGPSCPAGQDCISGRCQDPPACAESPCGFSPQCGCGLAQACDVNEARTGRQCRASGLGREGELCSGLNDCAAGFTCTDGLCLRFCDSSSECGTGEGAECALILLDGSGGQIPGSNICSLSCDPRTAVGCAGTNACAIFQDETFGTVTSCRPVTGAMLPPLCTSSTDCPIGQVCGGSIPFGTCVNYCRIGVSSDCTGTCTALAGPPVWGGFTWGTC